MSSNAIDQINGVRRFFDEDSFRYLQNRYQHSCSNVDEYSYLKRKDLVFNLIGKDHGRVLDIGCGPAVYTPELLERGYEVWGVDLSPKMIERAKERILCHPFSAKAHFLVGDLLSLSLEENFFDILLCIGVLSYVSDVCMAFQQIARLLKPGGMAILQASNPLSAFELLEVRVARPLYKYMKSLRDGGCNQRNNFQMTPYSALRLTKLCKMVRLEKISLHYYDFRLPVISKVFPRTALEISKRLESFEDSPFFSLFGACYILKVQK